MVAFESCSKSRVNDASCSNGRCDSMHSMVQMNSRDEEQWSTGYLVGQGAQRTVLATARLIYILYSSVRKVSVVRPGRSMGDEHVGESLGVLILCGEVMMLKFAAWNVVGYMNTSASLSCTLHTSRDQGGDQLTDLLPSDLPRSLLIGRTPNNHTML
jgi:hypothetical protein